MKKKTAGIIYGILLFGILATVANAQVSTPNFFKKVGNAILMLQTPWELGSSSTRVAKGWFTNLDSTNATIGTLQISSQVSPGPLVVAASSNPDIRFTGDTNTGLSWIDADRMALMTGGTNRLTVNSSGNVGIGTTSPGARLSVVGVDSLSTSFAANISGLTGTGLVVKNNGNVGIGTTSPSGNLHVAGAGGGAISLGSSPLMYLQSTSSFGGLSFGAPTNNNVFFELLEGTTKRGSIETVTAGDYTYVGGFNGHYLSLGANSGSSISQTLNIATGGNVGIGTTAPTALLHLSSTAAQDLFRVDDNGAGDTTPFVINSGGLVGIGTTSPSVTGLQIGDSSVGSGYYSATLGLGVDGALHKIMAKNDSPTNTGLAFYTSAGSGAAATEKVRILGGGNVGIGTTSPGSKLTIKGSTNDGSTNILAGSDSDGANVLTVNTNGLITASDHVRAATAIYRRYYHLPISAIAPGASGATWTEATANNIAGWQLNAAGELVNFDSDVHSDWDGASDFTVEVYFQLLSAGSASDTVDLKLAVNYMASGDSVVKTQTLADVVTTTDGTQYKMYKATFTVPWDAVADIEVGDRLGFIMNLETDTSEIDNILIVNGGVIYNTTHIGVEDSDT